MIDTYERLCTLALLKAPKLGPVMVRKLIAELGSARAALEMSPASKERLTELGFHRFPNLHKESLLQQAHTELEFAARNKIKLLHFKDPKFPRQLLHCQDHPLLLYQKGRFSFEGRRCISVVGTRAATQSGIRFCRDLIEALAPFNPVVVSGLAFGIDVAAHRAALDFGLDTVACLAHSLDKVYPSSHQNVAQRIMEQGCLLSEYGPKDYFDKPNFIARNRIIAGLSKATVVVESAFKGGSLATADLALSYHREVYAVPGRPKDPFSEGCNALIRDQKAQLIHRPQDLIDFLGWEPISKEVEQNKIRSWLELPQEQQILVAYLEYGARSMDELIVETGWPVSKLSVLLFDLELKQLVRTVQGQQYQLI